MWDNRTDQNQAGQQDRPESGWTTGQTRIRRDNRTWGESGWTTEQTRIRRDNSNSKRSHDTTEYFDMSLKLGKLHVKK